jgi:RHS repeat-associated protein
MRQSQQLDLRAWLSGALRVFAIAALALGVATSRAGAVDMVLPGSFDVSPIGSATYRIPIEVPPGTAGMVPALTLDYDSGAGNGIMGMGWSLGGLPSITRCPRTMAQDGVRGGVNQDANDRFCLGGQRLMVISGAYGADGSEYRTEIDSYTRVIAHGSAGAGLGPSWFEVHTKAGQTMEFGRTVDAEVLTNGARAWMVNKVIDAAGNYFTVTYQPYRSWGMVYPLEIDYTANDGQGTPAVNAVKFQYIGRYDAITRYQSGALTYTHLRLSNVQTYAGGALVSDYRLSYQAGGGATPVPNFSQLAAVTRCDGVTAQAACLPSTTFGWTTGEIDKFLAPNEFQPTGLAIANGNFGWPPDANWTPIIGDFDGDGRTDIMYIGGPYQYVFLSRSSDQSGNFFELAHAFSNGWNFGNPVTSGYTPIVGDFNGDGKTDYLLVSGAGHYLFISNGDGSFTPWYVPYQYGWNFGVPPSNGFMPVIGDFNGDGCTDYMMVSGPNHYMLMSNCDGSFTQWYYGLQYGWNWGTQPTQTFYPIVGDFNGDGKTDFLMLEGPNIYVMISNGDGSFTQWYVAVQGGWDFGTAAQNGFTPIVGDFNGDGLVDFMMTSHVSLYTFLSKGDATFTQAYQYTGWDFGQLPSASWTPLIGDFNGDGKTDFMYIGGPYQYRFLAQGDGTFVQYSSTLQFGWTYGNPPTTWYTPIAGDFNGDGKTDYVMVGATSMQTFQTDLQPFSRLQWVRTGLGATVWINYQTLLNSHSPQGPARAYPLVALEPAMFVVQRVYTSNAFGGWVSATYDFGGAVVDASGRGFLGFHFMAVTDDQTGVFQQTYYNQAFPLTGLPALKETRVSAWTGAWLSRTFYNYACMPQTPGVCDPPTGSPYQDGTHQVMLASTVEDNWELNELTTALPEVTTQYQYDGYGNATSILVTTADSPRAHVRATSNSYVNDPTTWQLGRLTQAQQTNTLPTGSALTRTSAFGYDARGLLIHEALEPNNATLARFADYTRDGWGNITSTTVSSGGSVAPRTTASTYDSVGQFVVTVTDALGNQDAQPRTYDHRFGGLTSLTDPNGLTSTWGYDTFGRKATETLPGQPQTTFSYGLCPTCPGNGWFTVAHAAGSPDKVLQYDLLNRLIETSWDGYDGPAQTATNQISAATNYDTLGRIASRGRPAYNGAPIALTTYAYDQIGRVTQETRPDGSYTVTEYGPLAMRVTAYRYAGDPAPQARAVNRNNEGQTITSIDAAGNTTYAYDPFGNLTQTTDVVGNVTTMSYDLRGRKIAMSDPDLGSWSYAYDAFDQLVSQTDAKGQTVTMSYDGLGRLIQRVEPDLTSTWSYDSATCGGVAGTGKGKLTSAGASNGYQRTYSYDSLCRTTQVAYTIDQPAAPETLQYSYDANGKPLAVTYPNGLVVRNVYTARGYLQSVHNDATGAAYWTATQMDAEGRLTLQAFGNGVQTVQGFDANTGRLTSIRSDTTSNGAAIQNLAYGWDPLGNLTLRQDMNAIPGGLSESFTYDTSNRLTGVTFNNGVTSKSYGYDAAGNIAFKSDVGTYSYNAPGSESLRPHAVASITGTVNGVTNPTFAYDADGNMTSGAGRTVAYTSFNLPASIVQGATTLSWSYDSDHARTLEVGPAGTTVYLNPRIDAGIHVEKKITAAGYSWENYIYAGGQTVAIQFDATNAGGTVKTHYLHKDHLGSTQAITDESGARLEDLSYDPWGKRRNVDGSDDTLNTIASETHHGFTGHEHLAEVGLIHMNGRVYDPLLGRFMTADPTISSVLDSQAYNRYSYLKNNPLRDTDPSGFCGFFSCIAKFFGHAVKAVLQVGDTVNPLAKTINKVIANTPVLNTIATLAACYYGGPAGCAAASAATAYYQGASASQIGTAGIVAGLSALAFSGVGDATGFHGADLAAVEENPPMFLANIAGHAAIGCASSAAQGGSCGSGALSGAAGAAIAPVLGELGRGTWQTVAGVTISATVGGAASVLGGGKFENGAITASFGYLFNQAAQGRFGDSLRDVFLGPDQTYHTYVTGYDLICSEGGACNVDNARIAVFATQVPGYNGMTQGGGVYPVTLPYVGYIGDVRVYDEGLSITNVTELNHVLFSGYITNQIIQQGGSIYVRTFGEGLNYLPEIAGLNGAFGPTLFTQQHLLAREYFNSHFAPR